MHKVLILGVGNLLLKDEGIGVHLVQHLQKVDLPPFVEVVDGGTAGYDLIPIVATADKLIVVDALQGGGEPGTIYRITPDQLHVPKDFDLSLHQTNITETLEMAARIGNKPDTIIFGIEPAEISYDMELSADIAGKIPKIVELVIEEALRGDDSCTKCH